MRTGSLPCLIFLLVLGVNSSVFGILPTGFQSQLIVAGFDDPIGFAFLPDGRILIAEHKTGKIKLVVNESLGSIDPIFTVPEVQSSGIERGLDGIAIDPRYPDKPYVYLLYSHIGTNTIYLSRFRLSGDLTDPNSDSLLVDSASRFDILTDIPDASQFHNGGTLRFGLDSLLYISTGDDRNNCYSQDTTSLAGKINRIDVLTLPDTGSGPPSKSLITPANNPLVGHPHQNANLVYCLGLRNPFRFHIDDSTGNLFIADVGENKWEEINLATGDENFGWAYLEGPDTNNLEPYGCENPVSALFTPAILEYDRTGTSNVAIISLGIYHPVDYPNDYSFPPEYQGSYFYTFYAQGNVGWLEYDGSQWRVPDPVAGQPDTFFWATDIDAVTDGWVGPDGAIYYLSRVTSTVSASSPLGDGSLNRLIYGVNNHPVLNPIGPKVIEEGDTLQFRVFAGDPDMTVPILAVSGQPSNSVFIDSGNGAGSFTFTPAHTQNGVYSVTFIATDGLAEDSETVEITVTDLNAPPVLENIGSKVVQYDDTLSLGIKATDPDLDNIVLQIRNLPSNSSFVDSGNGSGSFTFAPDSSQIGFHYVTIIASDTALSDTQTVEIEVIVCWMPGDANSDNELTLADIIAGVNYLFNKPGWPACDSDSKLCWLSDLLCKGDWDGSVTVTLSDVIRGVNYLFGKPGGPWEPEPSGACCQSVSKIPGSWRPSD